MFQMVNDQICKNKMLQKHLKVILNKGTNYYKNLAIDLI